MAHPQNSSMAMPGRLAPVPEESMDGTTAAYPPRSIYRDLIQRVAVSGTQIRSTLSSHSQSGHSGYSYSSNSGASNSYSSNNSGCSSGSALSTGAADFGTHELEKIARQMVSDGYTQRMVQAFEYGGDREHALENRFLELHVAPPEPALVDPNSVSVLESWFLELDVAWVLQIRQEHGSQWQLRLQDNSGSSLQDFAERWIRGLTVMVRSIIELFSARHEIKAVARFGEASILKIVVFFDAIVSAFKAENLRTVLDMYICVCRELYNMKNISEMIDHSIMLTLSVYVDKLKEAIANTMEKVKTLIKEDDSRAMEVPQGWGGIHRNTRWIADCIISFGEAEGIFVSINNRSSISNDCRFLYDAKYDTIRYLKDMLLRKSWLCSDPSMRYLFLLNNSYFLAQMIEPCEPGHDWKLTLECEKYMDNYVNISWGYVYLCIPKSNSPGPLRSWSKTRSLAKFESAFNKTYQAQKFWKVPDPWLRDVLRRAIIERVVSSYRDYLKEHPELAEHVSRRNSTPEVLEEMLGQLFEG